MASIEVEELIRRAERLTRDEQLLLIERLARKAREAAPDGVEKGKGREPLVGEELVKLMESIDAIPYTPHPDGRTDISTHHDDILYPKHGEMT